MGTKYHWCSPSCARGYNVKIAVSEVMQTTDNPRVLKNRQVSLGNSIPTIVSPMQHLQVVVVRSFQDFTLLLWSEPHPRIQMSDYFTIYILESFAEILLHTSLT